MVAETEVLAAETRFFEALLHGSREKLERVLGPEFLLIEVMSGSEVPKDALVDLVGSGQLVFDSIARLETRVRLYGSAAVVTGASRLSGRFGEEAFHAHSRYTHIYARGDGGWRLVSAQGTPIVAAVAKE